MPTIHLLIKGKVQGVFYRATAKDVANKLSVTGWIKNTEDSGVEAVIAGTQDKLDAFIDWCWKGPRRAIVSHVSINVITDHSFIDFTIAK